MAGLGANGSALCPRDRRRICHWTTGEAHCRHPTVRSCPPNRQRLGRGCGGRRRAARAVLERARWRLRRRRVLDAAPENCERPRQRAVRRHGSVADVPGIGSARQARPHARTGDRLFPSDDDAHREPRSYRRRDCWPAGRADRTGAADYADSDRPWRRRPRRRAGAAGHALQSLCRPDRREAHPHRQLHQAVIGRRRVPGRHRLAREPAAAADEQHRARAQREVFAVDCHELPLPRARAGRDVRGQRRLQERPRSRRSHHRGSGARRDAYCARRRPELRTRRAVPHVRRSRHRLLGDPARAGIRRPVPHQARIRQAAAQAIRG